MQREGEHRVDVQSREKGDEVDDQCVEKGMSLWGPVQREGDRVDEQCRRKGDWWWVGRS